MPRRQSTDADRQLWPRQLRRHSATEFTAAEDKLKSYLMDAHNFHVPLTAEALVGEVASGTFAFKNEIKQPAVRLLWQKLGFFVAETLKQQKGVLLPSLGSFRVGPVVGESTKKIRPCFALLDARYGGVRLERPKYIVGGRAPIVQPNYGLLSQAADVHRGAGQRLVADLLQRLGVHILSSRQIKVELPGVGVLLTNRKCRLEFVFDRLLLEHFEREQTAVIKEMAYMPEDYEVQKGLMQVALHDPPLIKSPRGMARPVSAVSNGSRPSHAYHEPRVPFTRCLVEVLRLCNSADRIASGCVPRPQLEQWLGEHCRPSLGMLDGATLMQLLDRYTYGTKTRQILYRHFLDALDAALAGAGASPARRSPSPSPRPTSDTPAGPGAGFGARGGAQGVSGEGDAGHVVVSAVPSPRVGNWTGEASAKDRMGQQQVPNAQPDQYVHYCQRQLSPRSRADYDAFNRLHFEKLYAAREPNTRVQPKRELTPKVGEEPLNEQEYRALRSASPPGGRGRVPTPLWPSQQQRMSTPSLAAAALAPPRPFVHSPEVLHVLPPGDRSPSFGDSPEPASPSPDPGAQQGQQQGQQQGWQGQGGQGRQGQAGQGWQGQQGQGLEQQRFGGQGQGQQRQGQVASLPQDSHHAPASQQQQQRGRHDQGYDILAPPPSAPRGPGGARPPLSQYDIAREADPEARAKLKAEYAALLQEGWGKQIREKDELQEVLHQTEQRWPFGPVGVPMDKRPAGAISRPFTPISPNRSPRRR